MHDDGLAYVKEAAWKDIYNGVGKDPVLKMGTGLADIPAELVDDAIIAATDCPGECIYFSIDND